MPTMLIQVLAGRRRGGLTLFGLLAVMGIG
jgi:hypothetical protein